MSPKSLHMAPRGSLWTHLAPPWHPQTSKTLIPCERGIKIRKHTFLAFCLPKSRPGEPQRVQKHPKRCQKGLKGCLRTQKEPNMTSKKPTILTLGAPGPPFFTKRAQNDLQNGLQNGLGFSGVGLGFSGVPA